MALTKVRGSGIDADGQELILDADGDTSIDVSTDDTIVIDTAGSERARIDSSGNFFVSATATSGFQSSSSESGSIIYGAGGIASNSLSNDVPAVFNRLGNDGNIVQLKKDGSTVGGISYFSGGCAFVGNSSNPTGIQTNGDNIIPTTVTALSDNAKDLGHPSYRWDDIYATNGTIQTSDQNEKQDIASATAKELNVAKKLSALFKTFRWKSKVAEKGDKARTHTGIIAQEVQSAFSAEGLDASDYGLFISNTWWEKEISVDAVKADEEKGIEAKDAYTYKDTKNEKTDGYTERTRLGVRYPELFSFIFSSIEARLTALESK
tara:strand:- start:31 stop:993 length:963 start_codon:yes stop_codon:yes gene_type:complete